MASWGRKVRAVLGFRRISERKKAKALEVKEAFAFHFFVSLLSLSSGFFSPHFPQETDPGAPSGSPSRLRLVSALDPVKGILDQCVVQGLDKDAPLRPHPEVAVGIDNMSHNGTVAPGNHFK
jgi:hypothetical protein